LNTTVGLRSIEDGELIDYMKDYKGALQHGVSCFKKYPIIKFQIKISTQPYH